MQMNCQVKLSKTVRAGDVINVVHEIDEGWLYGTIEGSDRSGIFPRTYTK